MKYQFIFVQLDKYYEYELKLHCYDYTASFDGGKKLLEQNFYSPKNYKLKKVINLHTKEEYNF